MKHLFLQIGGKKLRALVLPVFLLAAGGAQAQFLTFSSSAGYAGQGSADGAATNAQFHFPAGIARDSAGNLYVTDSGNHTIRKISGDGTVSTIAGTPGIAGSADGVGTNALFNQPIGIAVDASGSLYVADSGNDTIRKITGNVVTTIAGTPGISGSANGTGAAALFSQPQGIAVDSTTNLYVADYGNHTIRVISRALAVTTLAGTPGISGNTDATGTNALFYQPQGVAVDAAFNVYVADTANGTLRRITPAGVVTTVAGLAGNLGASNGVGANAQFYQPEGIALDNATNIYVADYFNQTIRKITPAGVVTTLAGLAGNPGSADGFGNQARFWSPLGMVADNSANIYVADYFNGTIREITSAGLVTTLAGTPSAGSADGAKQSARFSLPTGAALDSSSNVYVADSANSTIRKITPAGQVTTFAGSPAIFGSVDATGTNASFNGPDGVAVDSANNIYVADTLNDIIRKISPLGAVSTFAGYPGYPNNLDGAGTNAQFDQPQGIAVDKSNNVYVADTLNNTIRKITSGGIVSTLAGLAGYSGSTDGTNSAARFNSPRGLAVDAGGNIFVADCFNHVIREITPSGNVTTIAGLAGVWGNADGANNAARFFQPQGLGLDQSNNLYVADSGNQTLRLLTLSGTNWIVSTVAGLAGAPGNADGSGAAARFDFPTGVAFDNSGSVFVTDSVNNTIRLDAVFTVPILISNLLVLPRPSSAIISWTTTNPATSQVAYGLTPSLGNLTPVDANLVTNHSVLLNGLSANSTYYFQAISTSAISYSIGGVGASNGFFSTSLNIILQSPQAVYSGVWVGDTSGADHYSPTYKHAPVTPSAPSSTATFTPTIITPALYDVYVWYSEGSNRSLVAPVSVSNQGGSVSTTVNETLPGGQWQRVFSNQNFAAGTNGFVQLGNNTGEGGKIVISDAVMLAYSPWQDLPVNGNPPAWWLNLYFGTTNVNSSTPAANGYSLLSDYVLGISPNDPNTVLTVNFHPTNNVFQTVFAPVVGGRIYQLQASANLASAAWANISNATVTQVNGQGVINYTNTANTTTFYRLSVQLAP